MTQQSAQCKGCKNPQHDEQNSHFITNTFRRLAIMGDRLQHGRHVKKASGLELLRYQM